MEEYHIVYADDMGISTVHEPRLHLEGEEGSVLCSEGMRLAYIMGWI